MAELRSGGRRHDETRVIKFTPQVADFAEGSVLVEFGRTRVYCTASYEDQAPKWLQGSGQGWVTAEYGMLPRSTHSRMKRDKTASSGRTQEISRLIGRSLRAAVDLKKLGERQITIDCDVLNADGGTRTAAITGGFVALAFALKKLHDLSEIKEYPLIRYVSAISVGMHQGQYLLDLDYEEDVAVGTDMNFVMVNSGEFVELQGTGEHALFSQDDFNKMLELAKKGCQSLFAKQSELVGSLLKLG